MRKPFLERLVDVRPEEVRALLWSFLFFLFVLTSYYVLRAVREERAVAAGVGNIRHLFGAVFVTILVVTPLWAALVARVRRTLLLPLVYRFFVLNLVVLYALFRIPGWAIPAARIFFIWLTVYSVVAVTVFWSFMADLFTHEQGRRLFGFISAGGSAGAILGPLLTSVIVHKIHPAALLLVSAALIEGAARCVRPLARSPHQGGGGREGEPVGGNALAGIAAVVSSPYLRGIAVYVAIATITGTFGYILQAQLVAATDWSPAARTALFARMDLAANAIITVLQALVVGRLLTGVGVTATIAVAPPVMVLTFAVQAFYPSLAVSTVLQVLRRALAFGLVTPALHVLFTVVEREQKYKAKAFVDTVVYPGGGWVASNLMVLLEGTRGVALVTVPLGALWLVVALLVGKAQRRLAERAPSTEVR